MQNYKKISKHKEKCNPFGGIMAVTPYYIYSTQTRQAQHSNQTSAAHPNDKPSPPTRKRLQHHPTLL